MEYKRLLWADSLKGWLIILVVLGHSIQHVLGIDSETNHIWNIIYSFHMPAFMAVSGYLAYRPANSGSNYNVLSSIFRRFRQLVIPFFLWTLILLSLYGKLSINAVEEYIIYPDNGLWFLLVLFFISTIFFLASKVAEIIKFKQEYIMTIMCIFLTFIQIIFELRILGFQFIAYYFLFYTLGFYVHKYENKIITKNSSIIFLLLIIWLVLAWFWKMHELPFYTMVLPYSIMLYLYRFITAVIAVYLLFVISPRLLNGNTTFNNAIGHLGCISLGIYTTHVIIMGRVVHFVNEMVTNTSFLILISFFVSLLVSYFVVWVLNRWSITKKILLGKI
jgi:fucose 4-O-acetylase-like acetyltransferase